MNKLSSVSILAKRNHEQAIDTIVRVAQWLNSRKIEYLVEESTAVRARLPGVSEDKLLSRRPDVFLVLGGDGTFLWASRLAGNTGVPLLGINLGGLGFLTEIGVDGALDALDRVASGRFRVVQRMRLEVVLKREGRAVLTDSVLNDAAVSKGALARMIELTAFVDGQFLADYRSDGLVLASPTGSTAYSLAAGGPIVAEGVDCILLTPLCPHTLTHRPLVLPSASAVRVVLNAKDHQETFLSLDGQVGRPLVSGDSIDVSKSAHDLNVVRLDSQAADRFNVLRTKLRWGGR